MGFHIINRETLFLVIFHEGLIRQVIGSQADVNISSSVCIIWQLNQSITSFQMRWEPYNMWAQNEEGEQTVEFTVVTLLMGHK